jgi:hypothetical protein
VQVVEVVEQTAAVLLA